MSVDASPVTVRVPLPYDIPRGRSHTISAPLYRDGSAVAATAVSCTLYTPGGEAITGPTASVVSDVAQLAIGASDLDGRSYDTGWWVTWAITHAGGIEDVTHEAALVRSTLHPVITPDDLYRRQRGLDASDGARRFASRSESVLQDSIDEAWVELMMKLRSMERYPHLIMQPSALRQPHLFLTLAVLLEDVSGSATNPGVLEMADRYRRMYDASFKALTFAYDADQDGRPDSEGRTGASDGSFWLMGRGA